jgi:hypothetical protein
MGDLEFRYLDRILRIEQSELKLFSRCGAEGRRNSEMAVDLHDLRGIVRNGDFHFSGKEITYADFF